MRVNNDIEYVSLAKKEEDFNGVTPEPAKPILLLKQEKSIIFAVYNQTVNVQMDILLKT